jgi:hypothetical protein
VLRSTLISLQDAWGIPTYCLCCELSDLYVADVEIYHLESREPLLFTKVSIAETGPVRASLHAQVKLPSSTFEVKVRLAIIFPSNVNLNLNFIDQ